MQNPEPNTANSPQGPSGTMPTDATAQPQGQQGGSQQQQQGSQQPGSQQQGSQQQQGGGTPPQGARPSDSPTTGYEGPIAGPDGGLGVSLTGNDASAEGSPEQQRSETAGIASQQSGGAQAQQAPLGEQNPDNWEEKQGLDHTRAGSNPN